MALSDNYIVSKDTRFADCFLKFSVNNLYQQLLVVDNDVCIGVIGLKEFSTALQDKNCGSLLASDILNSKFTSLVEGPDTYEKCLDIFNKHNFCTIPILSDTGKPVRLVHRRDFSEFKMVVSFAQFGEDVVFNYVLFNVPNIFYIDVGAFDPWEDNVTKWISLSGRGHGINVEPQELYYNRLVKDRPNDINLQLAVSDSEGELKMYSCYGLTTAVDEYADVIFSPFSVKQTTLAKICDSYVEEGQPIHFLKIDVEGFERQVLAGADLKKYRPWIIMLEATKPNSMIPTHDEWEDILFANGYSFARQYGINRFYLAKEHQELLPRFINMSDMAVRMMLYSKSFVY
jgi:FkbM family methyltransferase